MFIIAYLVFFLFLYKTCNKRFKSPVLNFVLLFYVAAASCGVLLHFFKTNNPCTLFSFVYQTLIFFFFLKPIISYSKHERNRKFILISNGCFYKLSYVLIGLQLFSIFFYAEYDFSLLMRGDFMQIRSEMLSSGEDELGASLSRTIAGTSSYFYCYNILLFFYSLAFRQDKKWLLILLIISSTSRIFHAFSYMGRDGLLFWILSFLFSFFLFKPYLNKKAKHLIRKTFYVLGSLVIALIAAISLSRFGDSDDGAFWSLVSYLGQPIDNFAKMFQSNYAEWRGLGALFPILFGVEQTSATDLLKSVEAFESKYGFKNNVFFSFVGNMYLAIGPFFSILFSFIYCKYMSKKLNRNYTSMSVLVILMIASQVVIQNYFYWAYYLRVANFFLLATPLFILYFNKGKTQQIVAPYSKDETN